MSIKMNNLGNWSEDLVDGFDGRVSKKDYQLRRAYILNTYEQINDNKKWSKQ